VNKDPYGAGWLTKLEISNAAELDSLFRSDSADLAKLIAVEKQKYNK
jgi:glycine cleavage system H lipoate-binding protein